MAWLEGETASLETVTDMDMFARDVADFLIELHVIDASDPACDLVLFWTFFKSSTRELFRSLLPFDSGTWARARGWALWKALITYRDLHHGDPSSAEDVRALIHSIILFP